MKIVRNIVLVASLLLIKAESFAQNFTNKGKEFWVGYGHHQFMEPSCDGSTAATNTQNMVLYLSAEQKATVTVTLDSSAVTFPARPAWSKTYVIFPNTVIQSDIIPKGSTNAAASGSDANYDARLFDNPPPIGSGGEGVWRKKGIHIVSDVPIVAYAHIYGSVSSAATMLLPIETWGYSYTSTNSEQRDADRSYSWMYVVAKDDNTRIRITPSAASRKGRPLGAPFTVDLMKGQIYQYVAQSDCNTGNGPELTGTRVKSIVGADNVCHPIAVFSGSSRTGGETLTCGTGSGRDNDMQQNYPEHAWGKRYLTAPFSKSTGANLFQTSVYKVVVIDPATVVTRNGVPLTGLINNSYYKYSSNTADYIVADKPVMVAQFMSGTAACNGGLGDPEIIYLSPIEQAINNVGFYRNTKEAITFNYLTLIVPTPGLASLRIDNSSLFNYTYAHPNLPGYTVVVKGWTASQNQCLVRCDSGFNAITYGLGGAESYGYNAGTYLKNLNAEGEVFNKPDTTNKPRPFTCTGTPMEISALIAYKPSSMNWKVSTLGSVVSPNADVFISNPTFADTIRIGAALYYRYKLPGTYQFNTPGTYDIPIVNTSTDIDNCSLQETVQIKIAVKPKPSTDFSYSFSGCRTDSVAFFAPATTGTYTIAQWNWKFGDGDTSVLKDPKHLYGATGTYNVRFTASTTEGCLADTTKQVTIGSGSAASIVTSVPSACAGSAITFSDTTSITSGTFYWDFGFGTPVSLTSNTAQNITFPAPGTYRIKHFIKPAGNCPTDTVYKNITVFAKPSLGFTYPAGCLPANGVVQFASTTSVPDSQAIAAYTWDFGDPNANGGNPNTSVLANPSHSYAYGSYNIKYSAMTANGCYKDTIVAVLFNVRPQSLFGPMAAVCEKDAPFILNKGSVLNPVPGRGKYLGRGVDTTGLFTPSLAGAGLDTLRYVFISTGGCTDTAQQTIRVHATPKPLFSFPNGCLPVTGLVTFTNNTTVSDSAALTYNWNFGDANANAGNPNSSTLVNPSHLYNYGSYSIRLTANSANGCSRDTVIAAVFNVKPLLSYPALPPVCENAASLSVATATVGNGVPGTGIYMGTATDSAGVFKPAVAGPGLHTIRFVYRTASGCNDTISQNITVWPAPKAGFTFTNGCLSPSGLVQFSNTSTISDNSAITYSWNFGDAAATTGNPNTSTLKDPTHIYAVGSYSIKLTAASANGCSRDTIVTANFTVKPSLNWPALTAVCENAAPLSVATATVTNGVPGTGVYKGAGTTSAGLFNPQNTGSGTFTIWYVFTANGGCVDSVSQTIRVSAAPKPSFTFPNGCLPANGQVVFTNTTTISDGSALTYNWNFGDGNTSTQVSPTHNYSYGSYTIKLTVNSANGCMKDTLAAATFNVKPSLNYPALSALCENTSAVSVATATVTNGVPGTGKYLGPGTDSAGKFTPSIAGAGLHTIRYVFTATGGCVDTAIQTIRVWAAPKPSFTFTNGCLPASGLVQFTNGTTISDASALSYSWSFGDGSPVSTQTNPSHNFAYGSYSIKLSATSANGCSKDTIVAATFNVVPVLSYPVLSEVCENITSVSVASATVTNGVPGTGVYSGPGTNAAGLFSPGVAGNGTHTIKYVFTSTGGCKDSVTQTIKVNAKPKPYFTYPVGCLPTTGLVQFTNTTTIADGQTITYNWNFADPLANAGNPNVSTFQNPTHNYSNTGSYTIRLTATSAKGCIGDTTRTVTFSVKPQLSYPKLASVCQSAKGVTVTGALVLNGVSGNGVYSGPGVATDGTFNPALAGAGTHTVKYIFTSTGGCADSVSSTIKVLPKPSALFTVSADVCLNALATINPAASISTGTIKSYSWDFGDGTTAAYGNGNSFTRGYTAAQPYTIRMVAVSDSNCVSDTATGVVNIRPLPLSQFTMPTFVCMPGGSATFNSTSNVADGSLLTYNWNFGDGSPAVLVSNPSHVYAAISSYPVTLTVTTPYGCTSATTQSFSAFYDKPIARFSVTPDVLCQGSDNVFSDYSTAPNSTVTFWNWNFGDGSPLSTTKNPVKRYNAPGNFTVTLTVKNAFGCTSDPYLDTVIVYLQPKIDAGPSFVVAQGTTVTFRPTANAVSGLSFNWTPAGDFANPGSLQQSLVATKNQTYTLTAVGAGNCTATDTMSVKILRPVTVPNSFSPNGDGINDTWVIPNLVEYPNMNVEVYNRYGQKVYEGVGYSRPWDGAYKGSPLPFGTYYYIINLRNGFAPLTGSVTIVK